MARTSNEDLMRDIRVQLRADHTLKHRPSELHAKLGGDERTSLQTLKRYLAKVEPSPEGDLEPFEPWPVEEGNPCPPLLEVARMASERRFVFTKAQASKAAYVLAWVPTAPATEVWVISLALAFPASALERQWAMLRMMHKPWESDAAARSFAFACEELLGLRDYYPAIPKRDQHPKMTLRPMPSKRQPKITAREAAELDEVLQPSGASVQWVFENARREAWAERQEYIERLLTVALEGQDCRDEVWRRVRRLHREAMAGSGVVADDSADPLGDAFKATLEHLEGKQEGEGEQGEG